MGISLEDQISASEGSLYGVPQRKPLHRRVVHSEAMRFVAAERKAVESLGFTVQVAANEVGYELIGLPLDTSPSVEERYGSLFVERKKQAALPWP